MTDTARPTPATIAAALVDAWGPNATPPASDRPYTPARRADDPKIRDNATMRRLNERIRALETRVAELHAANDALSRDLQTRRGETGGDWAPGPGSAYVAARRDDPCSS